MSDSDRPYYIPKGAHWGWVVLRTGELVGAWVDDGRVWIWDPVSPTAPWGWTKDDSQWRVLGGRITGVTWDQCKAIWDSRPEAGPQLPADDDPVGDALRASTLTDNTPSIDWEARRWELFQRLAVGACKLWMNPDTACGCDEAVRDVRQFCDAAIAAYKEAGE